MRASSVVALVLASGSLLVTGCSGSFAGPSSPSLPSVIGNTSSSPQSDPGLLYVVNHSYDASEPDTLWVYKQKQAKRPIGQITQDLNQPSAVSVDAQGNLWVANIASQSGSSIDSTILRFRPGSKNPDVVLNDQGWMASALWVSRDGHIYVVNTGYDGICEIIVYPPKKKNPKVVFSTKQPWFFTAIAGDAKGDLFAAGVPLESGPYWEVTERPAGSKKWQNTGVEVSLPTGLAFDAAGNLVAVDDTFDEILTFPPGQTTPSNTIQCPGPCYDIAFDQRGNHLWVGEVNDPTGSLAEMEYPSGKLIRTLHLPYPQSSPLSVAADPGLSE